ncbi:hypothetical protein [Hymenobacter sp. AT01-02]|uniref:hypothetical protein n=1 Tax=Hymenobacter sp. AT01-02 TaxID=1571877 RepID=UPI0005F23515|nr:hypothetical protein [Hymenobacter sp. AT01-02]
MAVTIPANDRKASNLYFLSLAVSVTIILAFQQPLKPTPHLSQNAFYISQVVTYLLLVILGWEVREGHRWAKVVLLLLHIPSLLLYLARLPLLTASWPQTGLNLLSATLQVGVIVIITRDLLRRPEVEELDVATEQ